MSQKDGDTQQLLESLLTGQRLDPSDLDNLLREQVREDQYLDYKNGKILGDARRAAKTIREYLSGFANSAGGILIIGVDDSNWTITGCSAPGGGDLAEWASRCLTQIASHFSPFPRFQVVKHNQGDVLVGFTERSLNLVPCIEAGSFVYHFRLYDQTLKAPEYLIGDLMLGRRQFPDLRIAEVSTQAKDVPYEDGRKWLLEFQLNFVLENASLSWAEDVRLGIIAWRKCQRATEMSGHLLSYVEIQEPCKAFDEKNDYNVRLEVFPHQPRLDPIELDPLSATVSTIVGIAIPLRVCTTSYRYIWRAAVYLMAKGTPPVWYQLGLSVNQALLDAALANKQISSESDLLDLRRLSSTRPVVAWEGFGELQWDEAA